MTKRYADHAEDLYERDAEIHKKGAFEAIVEAFDG